jgi:hypothetical protein
MGAKWTVLLFAWLLLSGVMPLNWMAGGNFTQSDFDILRAKIDGFNKGTIFPLLGPAAATLSTDLNTLWAPAWNVVIVYYGDGFNYDAVLYGYAFNGHWFWSNGFQLSDNKYISFVIWKDYNCVTWVTIDPAATGYKASSYITADTTAIITKVQAGYQTRNIAEVWLAAKDIQTTIAATGGNIFNDKLAYSVITVPNMMTNFCARVCVKNYFTMSGVGNIGGLVNGAVLILQMRAPAIP